MVYNTTRCKIWTDNADYAKGKLKEYIKHSTRIPAKIFCQYYKPLE